VADKILVYAFVSGDLVHVGHRRALQQAKDLGDYLIVGVITNAGIEAYKRCPVIPFCERLEMIQHLDCVDLAVKQDSLDPVPNLIKYQPDIVVHGDDWKNDFPGAEYMRSIGKKALRTKYYGGQNTTKIIEEIKGRITNGTL